MTSLPTKAKDLAERLTAWAALVNENATSSVFVSDEFRAEHREKGALLTEAATAILALEARLGEINTALSDLNITNDELLRLRNSMESKEWVQVWSRACQSIIDCVRECRRIAVLSSPTTTRT
jgi:hypothetical protein